MKNKKIKLLCPIISTLSAAFVLVGLADTKLQISSYTYESSKIPSGFDGYTILQISDLHSKSFGKNQRELLAMIDMCKPDMIVITGDMVNERKPGITEADDMFAGLEKYGQVFYISGNHERRSAAKTHRAMLDASMKRSGIVNLDGSSRAVSDGNGGTINICGLEYGSPGRAPEDGSAFNILLYHGANEFDRISRLGYDLVFSGHGHGGIVRLPFVGGLLGNDLRLFPKYDAGVFTRGGSTLICSRGLGGSYVPRFFNPPELVLVTLRTKNSR